VSLAGRWVGFDLDLTLVDSRPGIEAVYRQVSLATGVAVDVSAIRIGPPLEGELAKWFPADQIAAAADLYRSFYPAYAIESSPALPGALAAIAAVRDLGGRVIIISSKYGPSVELHLAHCGLVVDEVVGWAYGDGKRDALRAHDAVAYVGDFEADMQAAVAASVTAVGVTTGPSTAAELYAAGADVVLGDLREFPAWLNSWIDSGRASCTSESRLGVPPSGR
jgi:phosphoglycolate phosphatase